MYTTELLNRFIGDRVSNVAISPAWPWARKLNDRSINSLIPAVRIPRHRRCFLRLFSRRFYVIRLYRRPCCTTASETIARRTTWMEKHSPEVDPNTASKSWRINTRHKKPMDIFISGAGFAFLERNYNNAKIYNWGISLREFASSGERIFLSA